MAKACRTAWIAGLLGLLTQLIPMPAAADYLIHAGDVLEFGVSGAPDLSRRTAVNDDGKISLPSLGEIKAVGLSVAQLRQQVRDLLVTKSHIRNPDVAVEIVSYRPVYVEGDVASPGAYPYRPGLTVREAVAMADGLGAMQLRDRSLMSEAVSARSDIGKLAVELVTQAARVARLKAALSGQNDIDVKNLPSGLVAAASLAEIVAVQTQQLKAEQESSSNEKSHVERLLKTTRDQIVALNQAQQQEAAEVAQLQKDAARAHELLQQGLVQVSRVEEQQRAISDAQFRLFDVMARANGAQKDLEMEARELQEAGEKHKMETLQKLDDAVSKLATAQVELEVANEKLRFAGVMLKPGLLRGGREARQLAILRQAPDGRQQRLAAAEEADLLPGDTIEVSATMAGGVRPPDAAGAPAAVDTRPR